MEKTAVCSINPFKFYVVPMKGQDLVYRLSRKNQTSGKSRYVADITVISGQHSIMIPPKFEKDYNVKLAVDEAIAFLNESIGTP